MEFGNLFGNFFSTQEIMCNRKLINWTDASELRVQIECTIVEPKEIISDVILNC